MIRPKGVGRRWQPRGATEPTPRVFTRLARYLAPTGLSGRSRGYPAGKRENGEFGTTDIEIQTLYLLYLMWNSVTPFIVTCARVCAARLFEWHCGYVSDVTLFI